MHERVGLVRACGSAVVFAGLVLIAAG